MREEDRMPSALQQRVAPDEEILASVLAGGVLVLITDRRVLVGDERRVYLDVPIEGIRRVEYDIDSLNPATLVIVPQNSSHRPQVLTVEPSEYSKAAAAVAALGERLARIRAS
jgi:hypothetical protein